jgi:hypothetical protein
MGLDARANREKYDLPTVFSILIYTHPETGEINVPLRAASSRRATLLARSVRSSPAARLDGPTTTKSPCLTPLASLSEIRRRYHLNTSVRWRPALELRKDDFHEKR